MDIDYYFTDGSFLFQEIASPLSVFPLLATVPSQSVAVALQIKVVRVSKLRHDERTNPPLFTAIVFVHKEMMSQFLPQYKSITYSCFKPFSYMEYTQ